MTISMRRLGVTVVAAALATGAMALSATTASADGWPKTAAPADGWPDSGTSAAAVLCPYRVLEQTERWLRAEQPVFDGYFQKGDIIRAYPDSISHERLRTNGRYWVTASGVTRDGQCYY